MKVLPQNFYNQIQKRRIIWYTIYFRLSHLMKKHFLTSKSVVCVTKHSKQTKLSHDMMSSFVPKSFHNFSGYGCHLIVFTTLRQLLISFFKAENTNSVCTSIISYGEQRIIRTFIQTRIGSCILSQPHCCVGAMGQFVRKLETAKPDF